jgi:hypothetical protein
MSAHRQHYPCANLRAAARRTRFASPRSVALAVVYAACIAALLLWS